MTTYKQYTINDIGIKEIHQFLASHHKGGGDQFDATMLNAWAAEAEAHADDDQAINCAEIEIVSWDSISGHTEVFTVSPAGVDVGEYEDE